jgi:hypothetical protein
MRVFMIKGNSGDKGINVFQVFRDMLEVPAFKILFV